MRLCDNGDRGEKDNIKWDKMLAVWKKIYVSRRLRRLRRLQRKVDVLVNQKKVMYNLGVKI